MDLKPGRMENEVYTDRFIDVTEMCRFLEKCKAEGKHYTFFRACLAAVARVFYERPKLNWFVCNRHLYEHTEVLISFVAKMSLDDHSEEIMLSVPVESSDTIDTISEKIAKRVENLRSAHVDKHGANSAIDVLGKLPNPIRIPVFGFIKLLDRFGALPDFIMRDNMMWVSKV